MMQVADQDFQRELDLFNDSQGGPSQVAVAWHPQKARWQVFAIPVQDSHHPLARNGVTAQLNRPFPDDSGRTGVLLFTYQDAEGNFLPLDSRLFTWLRWADSFTDKHHYEKTIKEPELQAEASFKKGLRDMVTGVSSYWKTLDRLAVSMGTKGPGDWRHRYR